MSFDSDRPRGRRRRLLVASAVVLVTVAAGAGIGWAKRRPDTPAGPAGPGDVRMVALVKTDLSTSQSLPGTLGYGTARVLKGAKQGTVTWLPAPRAVVGRGESLFRVDDEPVTLFLGGTPLYRTLAKIGTVGPDVKVVAANLRALGYSIGRQPAPGTPIARTDAEGKTDPEPTPVRRGEGVLTATLRAAIKRWQHDRHLPENGVLRAEDIVVLPGTVRIGSVLAQLGDGTDQPVISVTPTTKVVAVDAAATETGAINEGDKVLVELPDTNKVPGRVAAVGTEVKTEETGQAADTPKITVTITLDKASTVKKFDLADVTVAFVAETHPDVLAAPVEALLALQEGGYAVQLATGGLVPVETGLFADGLVEVDGAGLSAGTTIVTTS